MKGKKEENWVRPPVVVIMGHVDSGKTSILDYIRKAKVVEGEAGGITQHIGAYQTEYNGKKITFIDTPGHEAFSAMRMRGSKIADVAVLVIDAVSGIQNQTKEVIKYIKEAGIEMVVVINKIDRKEANVEKIKMELTNNDVLVEGMGGEVQLVKTSATTGQGIDDLLEILLLIAEMQELKSNLMVPVKGVIIESYLDKLRGPMATVLVLEGILREGDIIATDLVYGKIKRMETFNFEYKKEFYPGDPVVVYGFQEPPQVGEKFSLFQDINDAKNFVLAKKEEIKKIRLKNKKIAAEQGGEQKVLNLIIKSDVVGTIEAIENVLMTIPQDKVIINIIEIGVGEVNENDVKKAIPSNAHIFAFNVKTTLLAKQLLEKEKIKVNDVDVIYRIVEKVKLLMEKMLKPEQIKIKLGEMKITVIFKIDKDRQIVGGKVISGEIKKGYDVEIIRDEKIIEQGKIISLQKNKKEVDIARKRDECAVMYKGKEKIEENDYLSIYKIENRKIEL